MRPETESAVRAAIAAVEDPEVPVTLSDLGVLRRVEVRDGSVRVVLRPTRLACPARGEMARRVSRAVAGVAPGTQVSVDWELSAWQGAEVAPVGREVLVQIGYADPAAGQVRCPYCGSGEARRDGAFGGAVCKVPYSCRGCGSTYDVLRGSTSLSPAGAGSP